MALGVSLLAPPAPAAAHNQLTGSDPRDGARIATAPARIELRFLAKPDPVTTKVTVTGPDNVAAAGGAPTFSGTRVSVPFRPGRAGLYIVGYQVQSSDGHPISGEVRFALTTGTPADPSVSATPSASTGSPATASADPSPAGTTGAAESTARGSDEGSPWLWAGLGVLALVGAGVATVALRRRRTP
ncbi:copper resistance CopC family protein [Micromonospora thermarum]|uniref:copper resistance CopC family protein n=1 Tax=Micromonospora thermarum TaxID=2720024 RepID=UPI002815AB8E|nr:copper resistance protein CopC [Micromonospora thermarum]